MVNIRLGERGGKARKRKERCVFYRTVSEIREQARKQSSGNSVCRARRTSRLRLVVVRSGEFPREIAKTSQISSRKCEEKKNLRGMRILETGNIARESFRENPYMQTHHEFFGFIGTV